MMEKIKGIKLFKKWWFWLVIAALVIVLINNPALNIIAISFIAIGTIVFIIGRQIIKKDGIVNAKEFFRKNKIWVIPTLVAITLIASFVSFRFVQLYDYIAENPIELSADDSESTDETKTTDDAAETPEAETSLTDEPNSDNVTSFDESIARLKEDSDNLLLRVEPFDGSYDMLIAYVSNDMRYEDETNKLKVADYLGAELQSRALGTLFNGDTSKTPMVEIRYENGDKMAGSRITDIKIMEVTDN